jgi:HD-GYP domain-containing protein (c-di-GMP phosphodiesterase class II)/CheY-like chemotaxis protein
MNDAKPGMRLAYNIYDAEGHTLICKGSVLSEFYVKKLNEYGFSGIYISDALSDDIKIEPIITSDLRTEGLNRVKNSDVDGCKGVAKKIVEQILTKGVLSLDLKDLRSFDGYTYAHSVNVAVLSCIIGFGLKLNDDELEQLVMAGLLHDLGKLQIPSEILNKPSRLTKPEYEIMKTHARLSYEMIRERWDITSYVKTAVLYHHENVDGSGYPEGIDGDSMTIYTKILHVADVYDALVSRRPYKNSYSPYEACEYLMGAGGLMFEPKVVESLMLYVPLYPKGTQVKLSDGREGIIVDNSGTRNLRPLLRLLDGSELDMQDRNNLNLTIIRETNEDIIDPTEIEEERKQMIHNCKNHIMVIDDMVTNLQAIKGMLGKMYDVSLMKNCDDAILEIKHGHVPDLLIIDMDIPGTSGVEVLNRIKETLDRNVPVLFVIANNARETIVRCRRARAAGYVVRPLKQTYLKAEIRRILTGTNVSE